MEGELLKNEIVRLLRNGVANLRAFGYSSPRLRAQTPIIERSLPRIGVALGGGFARGFAHIGVLKVLAENGIPIHAMAGVSTGSIVAAAFAAGATIEQMTESARRIRWSHFARWTLDRLGFATNWRMNHLLRELLLCSTFEELALPLAVIDKAFQIAGRRREREWQGECDLLIQPDVREFSWDDFRRSEEIIQAGERAASAMLPALRMLVELRSSGTPVSERAAAG